MSDRALSEAAMLAGLQDIRLPADAPGGLLAEIAAGLGIGALAALLILLALRGVTSARARSAEPSLAARIAAARSLPDDARRIALLQLLKARAPEVHQRLKARLYARDSLDLAEIEAEVARLA